MMGLGISEVIVEDDRLRGFSGSGIGMLDIEPVACVDCSRRDRSVVIGGVSRASDR
jgi:hypothetical protein